MPTRNVTVFVLLLSALLSYGSRRNTARASVLPVHRLTAGCDVRRGLKTSKPLVPPPLLIERS